MKAYIVGGGVDGTEEKEGMYHLVTEDGATWASQWCSDFERARKDLYEDRAGLQQDWKEKYGEVTVLRLGQDATTFEKLVAKQLYNTPGPQDKLADGLYYSILTVKKGHVTKSEPAPIQELGHILVDALRELNK